MAQLTEQPISGLIDWMSYDSKLSILSAQENTSVERKAELAQREIETEVLAFLLRNSGADDRQARAMLKKVQVSEPIKRWHIFLTLSLFYADLASLQGSALHREQSRYYEQKAHEGRDHAQDTGVGIVHAPVPRGNKPAVTYTGTDDSGRLLRARVKFLNADSVAGSASDEFPLRLSMNGVTELRFAALPPGASAWRLFLAEDSDAFIALRAAPHAVGEVVNVGLDYTATGPAFDEEGQWPDRYIHIARNLWR